MTSPATFLTDWQVKAFEYQRLPSVLAYVILDGEERSVHVMRRAAGWQVETVADLLELPEVGVTVPLDEIYDLDG